MRLKKMLSVLAAATIAASSFAAMAVTASAAESYTVSFDNGATQSTDGYFTVDSGGGYNAKYIGTYGGHTYAKGLKLNSKSSIAFTSTESATVTIVQSLAANATKTFKLDTEEIKTDTHTYAEDTDNNYREYTITDVAAGEHTITYVGETGILFVKVEYTGGSTPTDVSAEATAYDGFVSDEASVYSVDFNTDKIYSEMVVTSSKLGDGSVADFKGYEGAVTYYLAINKSVEDLGTVMVTLK